MSRLKKAKTLLLMEKEEAYIKNTSASYNRGENTCWWYR